MRIIYLFLLSESLFGDDLFGVDYSFLYLVATFLIIVALSVLIKVFRHKGLEGLEYETTTIRKVKASNQASNSVETQKLQEEIEKLKEANEKREIAPTVRVKQAREKSKKVSFLKEKKREDTLIIEGIIYQNQLFTQTYTFEEAKEYAKKLDYNGLTTWRLPTINELKKLGNIVLPSFKENSKEWKIWFKKHKEEREINTNAEKHFMHKSFVNNMPKNSCFWSSEENNSAVWSVDFSKNKEERYHKEGNYYLLCVCDL